MYLNHLTSIDDIRHRNGKSTPTVDYPEQQHHQPQVFEEHVRTHMVHTVTVSLQHVENEHHYDPEKVVNKTKRLTCPRQDVQHEN